MVHSLTVRHLDDLPCASEFKTRFELCNIPVVIRGGIKTWKAYAAWNIAAGGLRRLQDLAGSSTVQAMASATSNFFGDIQGHERTEMAFGEILDMAGASLQERGGAGEVAEAAQQDSFSATAAAAADEQQTQLEEEVSLLRSGDAHQRRQVYLAQVPMFNSDEAVVSPLHPLMEDISVPDFLGSDTTVSNINFWMSVNGSRSSIHYDPFHNLLCVVTGSKQVTLWPPTASKFLYPHPLYGEASNHSAVNFAEPDYERHPLFREAVELGQTVGLTAGDVLFIPEGWYHQVNSEGVTIAVNIWWPSKICLALGTHMDGYYLRRVVASLVDAEKDHMLAKLCKWDDARMSEKPGAVAHVPDEIREKGSQPQIGDVAKETTVEMVTPVAEFHGSMGLRNLSPLEAHCLRTLVTSVSARFEDPSASSQEGTKEGPMAMQDVAINARARCQVETSGESTESVAKVFYSLEPAALQRLLLIMIDQFPHTLEALILYGLSPAAAEVLTKKFDQMDKLLAQPAQAQFFKSFYRIFDNPDAAMTALLNGMEKFAAQALNNVMEGILANQARPGMH